MALGREPDFRALVALTAGGDMDAAEMGSHMGW